MGWLANIFGGPYFIGAGVGMNRSETSFLPEQEDELESVVETPIGPLTAQEPIRAAQPRGGKHEQEKEKRMPSLRSYFYRVVADDRIDIKNVALVRAAGGGHTGAVRAWLDAGANVHADEDEALRRAALKGHPKTVKALLDAGANVHAVDDLALWLAAKNGHTETVKVLLNAGANAHAGNDAALRRAEEEGHTETVAVLKGWMQREVTTPAPAMRQPGMN